MAHVRLGDDTLGASHSCIRRRQMWQKGSKGKEEVKEQEVDHVQG
jgi:hypothetical protein